MKPKNKIIDGENCDPSYGLYTVCSSKYQKIKKIGEGTFGVVFLAIDKNNNNYVAMKKILMKNNRKELPITARREIEILQRLNNENIINLYEVCQNKATHRTQYRTEFYLIFELCKHDLRELLSNVKIAFELGEIKNIMKQLLNALLYIHVNKILHRDVKAANILITKDGILKLADFGLARTYCIDKTKRGCYTNPVVTLWYRSPELLLGATDYGPSVDLWSAGCIMAELLTREPLMPGETEQEQLTLITQLCGSITIEVWPGVEDLELYGRIELPKGQKRQVKEKLKPYVKDTYGCDLLDKFLILDPRKRSSAAFALDHDFFWEDPLPCHLRNLLARHMQNDDLTIQHQIKPASPLNIPTL